MASRFLALLFALASSFGCTSNITKAPPPPEASQQFILQSSFQVDGSIVYVVLDTTNDNLIYLTPGSGVAVKAHPPGNRAPK